MERVAWRVALAADTCTRWRHEQRRTTRVLPRRVVSVGVEMTVPRTRVMHWKRIRRAAAASGRRCISGTTGACRCFARIDPAHRGLPLQGEQNGDNWDPNALHDCLIN
jgi:hypothetical protein